MSQSTVSDLERGHLETLSMRAIKAVLVALDARLVPEVRWRGGQLDRLLDEGHASLSAVMIGILGHRDWQVQVEVSYSRSGERGSIDILAWHAVTRTLLVVEIKTELSSVEATLRKLDEKERLAGGIARERFGWDPVTVGVLLVVRDSSTDRARARRAGALLAAALPAGSSAARTWLRRPVGTMRGLWFLSSTDGSGDKRRTGGPDRVRRTRGATAEREGRSRATGCKPRSGRSSV